MTQKNKKIIAFAGRQRSGKTYLAKVLKKEVGAKIYTIADYLKNLCCELIKVDYDTLNELKNNKKELDIVPNVLEWSEIIAKQTGIDSLKVYSELKEVKVIKDVRELLQVIGTNIIRKYKPNWHIDKLIECINKSEDKLIAVDDVRFPNEYEAIKNIGGEVFFIIRTVGITDEMISNHQSEIALRWTDFPNERIIINDSDLQYLENMFMFAYYDGFTSNNSLLLSANFKEFSFDNPLVFEDLKCRVK